MDRNVFVYIFWDSKDILTRKPLYFKDFADEDVSVEYAKEVWESFDDEKAEYSVEVILTDTPNRKDPKHFVGYLYYQDGDDFTN